MVVSVFYYFSFIRCPKYVCKKKKKKSEVIFLLSTIWLPNGIIHTEKAGEMFISFDYYFKNIELAHYILWW